MKGFDVIIPARLASVRLPNKPLLDVAGKPLIVRVLEAARMSQAERIVVATDDPRIADAVQGAGGEVQMTADDHPSGTDRIAEAADRLALADDRIVVNVQGDEPDMPGTLIDQVAELLFADKSLSMTTAATPIRTVAEWHDRSVVKVACASSGRALYFSRASIPATPDDDNDFEGGMRHIGIYGYRAGFIRRYSRWPRCPLEARERLEQLRVLYHGEHIGVCEARAVPGPGVDTTEDLERVREAFARESDASENRGISHGDR